MEIDPHAKYEVEKQFVIPECLHFPIAARNKIAIERFVGKIEVELSRPGSDKAFLVFVTAPKTINEKLPIWKHERSNFFHQEHQVWVDVNYMGYRKAYKKAFPDENLDNMVLDHIMNRRVARIKDFQYIRIVPVSRSVNSSSAFSENWGVEFHSKNSVEYWKSQPKMIQYGDLTSLVTVLDIAPGGGIMEVINEAHNLIEEA